MDTYLIKVFLDLGHSGFLRQALLLLEARLFRLFAPEPNLVDLGGECVPLLLGRRIGALGAAQVDLFGVDFSLQLGVREVRLGFTQTQAQTL